MKNIIYTIFASMLLISSSCRNDDDNLTPIEQLPPATQTGENTIGCLLDGEVFLPDRSPNSTNCFYQLVNGEYYFHVSFSNRDENFNSVGLAINTNQLEIEEYQTIPLKEEIVGNASGLYSFANNLTYTSSTVGGVFTITKLDFQNNIVSGTFWYDIIDYQGNLRKIRKGRFDMRFTQ